MAPLVFFLFLGLDLSAVRQEPNLEKRSELALNFADKSIDAAKKAYNEVDEKGFVAAMDEVRQAAELSYQSLQATGKAARRSPKYFKRAELKLRALTKRLDNLEQDVGMVEKPQVLKVKSRLHELHDQVLFEIMTKK